MFEIFFVSIKSNGMVGLYYVCTGCIRVVGVWRLDTGHGGFSITTGFQAD